MQQPKGLIYSACFQKGVTLIIQLRNAVAGSEFYCTDSAAAQNLNYKKAINAKYEVIELCEDSEIGEYIGRLNFSEVIEGQPVTQSQFSLLQSQQIEFDPLIINKRIANELIIGNHL